MWTSLPTLRGIFIFNEQILSTRHFPVLTLLPLTPVFRKAVRLFSSIDEQLEFARDCDLDVAEVSILVERGQFFEAADLHIRENRMLDAVEVLLKNKTSKEATQRASQSLLDALWNVLSFGVLPTELDKESQANLKRMMQLIKRLDQSSLDQKSQLEVESHLISIAFG